jgi:arylsulfatase
MMIKWPGKIKPGQVFNDIISLEDWLPTLVAAAGDPNIKEKLLKGHKAGKMTYNVHLDGYNFLPYLTGKAKKGPREEMFYFTDGGSLSAFRYNDWKLMFSIQEATGFDVWTTPFTERRMPLILNLRRDPFERAWHEGIGYKRWAMEHMYVMVPAMGYVQKFLMTFKDYPQRQEVATWTLDKVIEKLTPKTN